MLSIFFEVIGYTRLDLFIENGKSVKADAIPKKHCAVTYFFDEKDKFNGVWKNL